MSVHDTVRSFFEATGRFDYTLAYKLATRVSKTEPFTGSLLTRLVTCESAYTSLAFLKPSRFRKDDFLTNQYATILDDIGKESSNGWASCGGPPRSRAGSTSSLDSLGAALDGESGWQATFALRLTELVRVRRAQIGVYRLFATAWIGNFKNSTADRCVMYQNVLNEVRSIRTIATADSDISDPFGGYGEGLVRELTILRDLIQVEMSIEDYCLKDAVMLLFNTRRDFDIWGNGDDKARSHDANGSSSPQPGASARTAFRSLFLSSSNRNDTHNHSATLHPSAFDAQHITWLKMFMASIMAKLTFYFQRQLLEKERYTGGDIRTLWKGIRPDYHNLISTFRKRSGVHSICLIYEVTPDAAFDETGYAIELDPSMAFTVAGRDDPIERRGLRAFPCIYSYPEIPPMDHWPNMISIMQSSARQHVRVRASPAGSTSNISGFPPSASAPANIYHSSTSSDSGNRTLSSTRHPPVSTSSSNLQHKLAGSTSSRKSSIAEESDSSVVHFYDWKVGVTYYLLRTSPKVTLALVFADKQHSGGENGIQAVEFLTELAAKLHHTDIFQHFTR